MSNCTYQCSTRKGVANVSFQTKMMYIFKYFKLNLF